MRRLALLTTFIFVGFLSAQAASFSTYGTGCPGSGSGTLCYGQNQNGGTFRFQPHNIYDFALSFTPTTNAVVLGFELYMSTRTTATVSTTTWVFAADASGSPTNPPLRTSTILVGPTVAFYRTTFAPLGVQQGKTYFIAYAPHPQPQLYFPHVVLTNPQTSQHFYRTAPTAAWNGPHNNSFWSWRVLCAGAAIPKISSTGLPKIGTTTFSVDLSQARPTATTLLAISSKKTSLPLAFIGAPGCTLLADLFPPSTSWVLRLPTLTSALGATSQKLPVPNNANLVGLVAYTQFAVADPVNPAGIVFSAGGQITVGK